MNKLLFLIPIIVTAIVIGIGISEVQAVDPPNQLATVKVVINFEHSANLNGVFNYYTGTVKPQAVTIINIYSANIDDFSMQSRPDSEVLYIIGFNEDTGKNIYELYPKVVFFGNLPDGISQAQFDNAFDNFLTDMKNMLKSELQSNGATNIKAHIHYTTGSIDE